MLATSRSFEANARAGLANDNLQRALALMRTGFPQRRRLAVERLPEFEALREIGKSIKDHTLEHLDFYLELYETNVLASGGRVHWARTPDEARAAVLEICRSVDAKIVTKGKSMIAEEVGLNEYLEEIVPTLEDTATLLRLLARSATGQEFSSYTTVSTGPRRPEDLDGPEQYHVVLLDNGRSALLGGEFQDMLRCIRCSACMNHCPVYAAVGGHAYGWVYSGPMGAVLTPSLLGVAEAGHLPNASTLCGRCETVCPVKIPLPKLMRHWREREFAEKLNPPVYRAGLGLWAWAARRPALYHTLVELASRAVGWAGRDSGRFRAMPMAAGWTAARDMPAPEGRSFHSLWVKQRGGKIGR